MTQYAIANGKVQKDVRPRQDNAHKSAPRAQSKKRGVKDSEATVSEGRLRGGDGERVRKKRKRRKPTPAAAAAAAAATTSTPASATLSREKDGAAERAGHGRQNNRRCGTCIWALIVTTLLLLVILVPVGVLVVGKKDKGGSSQADSASKSGQNGELSNADVPAEAKGTILDPFTWLDLTDFNTTYTDQQVGGLSIMGLNSSWDDSVQANDNVPPLNEPFDYGTMPFRGVNLGGWLILEPFITPSFFSKYDSKLGIVDEWTLCQHLGHTEAASTMEQHYSTFVTEDAFKGIRDAGLDHVRIPYGYWCVTSMPGDQFVGQICWRYLLRAIEWARKYGLRVNLDLHSVPGGENGWNHSGRQGVIGWLNGTDGDANAQKSLEIHSQLATFFSQPRYKNIITLYGLVNEPKMITLNNSAVIEWTAQAYEVVRSAGYDGKIIFGDGFRGLSTWKGEFKGLDGMLLDVHQYLIFNVDQIALIHSDKVKYACRSWPAQMQASLDTSTGFGPTMVGEWGQADTDCTEYLNNVGWGTRWEGDLNTGSTTDSVLKPCCNGGVGCSCSKANADTSTYTDEYKKFLLMFAEAQMDGFEKGWGWMYWTWDTESAPQWSYKQGVAAGILPAKAYDRAFHCSDDIPDFKPLGLPETY